MENKIPSTSNIIAGVALLTAGGSLINSRKVNSKHNKRITALEETMVKLAKTIEELQVENLKLRKLIKKQNNNVQEVARVEQPVKIERIEKRKSYSVEEEESLSEDELSEDAIALMM